jgi:hypothetical protein
MKANQIHEGVNYHLERGIPLHESVYRLGSDEYFNMFVEARKLYNEGKLRNLHWFDEMVLRDTDLGEWVNIKDVGRVPLDMIISEENHRNFLEGGHDSEKRWKQTSMSPDEAIKQYGKENVKVKKGALRNGDDMVSVYVESYSPGDENEEGMVSNCCGAPIMDVYDGHGRCSDCKEMAQAVAEESVKEAEYQGRKVQLSKPKRGGSKKFYVYVRNPKTKKIKKVAFGAAGGGGNLAVKLKDPKARKAFSDRHNCEQKNDKTKPGYWSCRLPRYAKSLGLSGGGTWW